jgi:hypothetical protein
MKKVKLFASMAVAAAVTTVTLANVTSHNVSLKHMGGEAYLHEAQNGRLLSLYTRFGEYEVQTDAAGKPSEYMAVFGPVAHWDLNGDGTIDARYDRTSNEASIWIEDQWVRVNNTKTAFTSRETRSADGAVYYYKGGRWATR